MMIVLPEPQRIIAVWVEFCSVQVGKKSRRLELELGNIAGYGKRKMGLFLCVSPHIWLFVHHAVRGGFEFVITKVKVRCLEVGVVFLFKFKPPVVFCGLSV